MRKGQHEKGLKKIICLTSLRNNKETSVSENESASKENQRRKRRTDSESLFRAIVATMVFYSRP